MKKHVLTLILTLDSCSAILAMDQKTDSKEIVLAQKATQASYDKHLDQLSFTAFHPHELNPALATQKADGTEPLEPSLYGRFAQLPIELGCEISQYLAPHALSCARIVFTHEPEEEIKSIKDFLRTHYWLQGIKKAKNLPTENHDQYAYPFYNFARSLNHASQNKYGKHNLEIAALAIACETDINKRIFTNTPLEYAAHKNLYSLSKMLIQQGISLDDSTYVTPLYYAIQNDSVVMTQLFMAAGYNFAMQDDSLMYFAARLNASRVIKYLHNQGHDVNEINRLEKHSTPLHIAARRINCKAIETLLACGADPTLKDSLGQTCTDILNNQKQRIAIIKALNEIIKRR